MTTLFTFYWDITIETINFAKQFCKSQDGVMVGGVMATILKDRVHEVTGIGPYSGTLSTPGVLDDNEEIYKRKRPRKKFVDFNQGIESRLITNDNMEKMFEIPVRPVRIAFDHWELHDIYEQSIRTAVRHGRGARMIPSFLRQQNEVSA